MATLQQTCKSCGNVFGGKFCNQCGEQVYTAHDKSLGHILEEGFHFITHFEGKFLGTLKTVLLQPGKLTVDYTNGIRKKYFRPVSFFLMLVILYLLFPVLRGLNMDLPDHLGNGFYGNFAAEKITAIARENNWSDEQVTEKFHLISTKVSKFLLLIIIPVMALFNLLTFRKRKMPLFDHIIFSTETASFFLLWGFLILPLAGKVINLIIRFFGEGYQVKNETITIALVLIPFLYFMIRAAQRFYRLRFLKAFLFAAAYVSVFTLFILTVYKFLLFLISVQFLD